MTTSLTRAQKRLQQQLDNDAAAVLNHPPSVRFLCRILTECRYFEDAFAGNSNTTFKNLGEQEAARKIVRALQASNPDALIRLLETAAQARDRAGPVNEEAYDE